MFLFVCFLDRSHSPAQAGLQRAVVTLQSHQCGDVRHDHHTCCFCLPWLSGVKQCLWVPLGASSGIYWGLSILASKYMHTCTHARTEGERKRERAFIFPLFFFFLFFRQSYSLQAGLELPTESMITLNFSFSAFWDWRPVFLYQVYAVLGTKPGVLCTLGKPSAN